MKISRINSASLIALFTLLIATISLIAFPFATAHDPAINIPTTTNLTVSPNPVGVNQTTTISFWNTFAPPNANTTNGIRWRFTVTVTNPSTVTTTLGTFVSDTNGEAFASFIPTMSGNWTVTVTFPATVYTFNSSVAERVWTNDTFLSSTASATFAVQDTPVPTNANPLPTEYWLPQTPGEDFSWFTWDSNWYGANSADSWGNHNAQVYSNLTGPLTGHVMWTRPLEDGGMVGGDRVGVQGNAFYMGLAYQLRVPKGSTFILDGRYYFREPLNQGISPQAGGYVCVDMRTGQILFRAPSVTTINTAYSCNGVHLLFGASNFGTPRDPLTLNPSGFTLSGVPGGTEAMGPNNEALRITVLGNTTAGGALNVQQWNSSKVLIPGLSGTIPAGGADKYDFNVSITRNGTQCFIPSNQRTVLGYWPDDFILLASQGEGDFSGNLTLWNISLKPATRGQVVFNGTYNRADANWTLIGANNTIAEWTVSPNMVEHQNHIVCLWATRQMMWMGINFDNGKIWGPTASESDWNFYSQPDNTNRNRDAAFENGKILSVGYGGILYCYDSLTGNLTYTLGMGGQSENLNQTSTGFQTVYGVFPTFAGLVLPAEGKIYTFVNEHSPNTPLLKTGHIRCVDIATGREDWILSSYGGFHSTSPDVMIAASHYMIQLDNYDQQLYCIGRGPSKTTVTTGMAENGTNAGGNIVIEGTVMDTAAGTTQDQQLGRFPYGIAAVADTYVDEWMEYVYMNRPRPQVTGVPVQLSVIDATGTETAIGTTASDSTGYFHFLYTSEKEGTYTLVARFNGSAAYYPSSAKTVFSIAAPVPAVVIPPPEPAPMTDTYLLLSAIGIIVALAVVGGIVVMVLKRNLGGKGQ